MNEMKDIPQYDRFIVINSIDKGLSENKKYYIETNDGHKLLLRITDIASYDRKKAEYEFMKKVDAFGVPMSRPLSFGICNNGKSVYLMLSWCEGKEVETLLSELSEAEQYDLGVKAGQLLRKIHSVPAPGQIDDWYKRFSEVNEVRYTAYHTCGIKFEGDQTVFDYLNKNNHLLVNRPQCFKHGDFHIGNLIHSDKNELAVIDWEVLDFDTYGDPWYELSNADSVYPHFATGEINGYFNNDVPSEFWRLLAFYIANSAITSIAWATSCGQEMVSEKLQLCRDVLKWFDNMQNPVPSWYLKNYPAG